LGPLLTLGVPAAFGRLIKGESRKWCSLLPFRYEAASGFPVDFCVIEKMNERPGAEAFIFGKSSPRFELRNHFTIGADDDGYPEVSVVAIKLDYIYVLGGRRDKF
jgi:hypothetical protein